MSEHLKRAYEVILSEYSDATCSLLDVCSGDVEGFRYAQGRCHQARLCLDALENLLCEADPTVAPSTPLETDTPLSYLGDR